MHFFQMEGVEQMFGSMPLTFFSGDTSPAKASRWLREVSILLDSSGCSEGLHRVALASGLFLADAKEWWQKLVQTRAWLGRKEIQWPMFVEFFCKKYTPDSLPQRQVRDFLEIEQGAMSVGQYVVQFSKLAYLAPFVVMSEARACQHFVRGLRPEIRHRMGTRVPIDLRIAINNAAKAEWDIGLAQWPAEWDNIGPVQWPA